MITSISPTSPDDYPRLLDIWEAAVRATHHFLTDDDIATFRPLVIDEAFPAVKLACVRDESSAPIGFVGTLDRKVEMLFVHPAHHGKGIGKELMKYAIERESAVAVDVNEQNPGALAFYQRLGFEVVSRSPVDASGKPFPLLHLRLPATAGSAHHAAMNRESMPVIRRASAEDAALLARLGEQTFVETFAEINTPEDMAAYLAASFTPEQLAIELSDSAATFLIAEAEGIAAGYAKLYAGKPEECIEGPKPVELVRLYVLREFLGRAVGAALMSVCMDEARRAGHETIWLGVWEHNERAKAFYRKWGFREVGSHVFQLGSDAQTDLLMERPL